MHWGTRLVGPGREMAQKPLNKNDIDVVAYREAEQAFRLANEKFAPGLLQDLAKEVVRRLAFRMPKMENAHCKPAQQEIEAFCDALLSPDETSSDRIILNARADGVPLEVVYLSYIAGASRRLGKLWEDDVLSFVDVSLGTARLYRIIRGLRHSIAPIILEGRSRRPALFALAPGESHTLGIEIAADLFRRDGGDVDVCLGNSHDEILALADTRQYSVIVLAAHSDRSVSALLQLAVALRITQPLTPFALAGGLLEQQPEIKAVIGAEMVITDIKTAIPELKRLIAADS